MVIYGRGYRSLEFTPTGQLVRLWPVAWNEYRSLFRSRLGVALFLVCLGPSIANLGILLVQLGVWQIGASTERLQSIPRMNPEAIDFYLVPILGEVFSFVVFLILTSLVSCRAVAKDRETQALEIYWTRGISPRGYLLAKWMGSFLLVGTAFVAAPAVTWAIGIALAPDWQMLRNTLPFVPVVLVALALFTAAQTFVAIAFSAVASTANIASLLWFFLVLGTTALGRVLARVFEGEYWFKAINPWDAGKRLVEWMCGYAPPEDYDPRYAAVSMAVVLAVAIWATRRRMRLVEAIG